jgi:ferredoxin
MITNDATLLKVKHEVLYEVAKLAYAGRLEEERDSLPYKMVPGPQPAFRCCIYREREVIRQRIRLAEGKAPGAEDDGNIVQVINSACEGCPISRYVVTDNCQKCMGKACQAACRFGAISMISPILIHLNVKSVGSVQKPVLIMRSQIWYDLA